jgi:hypothetical protein
MHKEPQLQIYIPFSFFCYILITYCLSNLVSYDRFPHSSSQYDSAQHSQQSKHSIVCLRSRGSASVDRDHGTSDRRCGFLDSGAASGRHGQSGMATGTAAGVPCGPGAGRLRRRSGRGSGGLLGGRCSPVLPVGCRGGSGLLSGSCRTCGPILPVSCSSGALRGDRRLSACGALGDVVFPVRRGGRNDRFGGSSADDWDSGDRGRDRLVSPVPLRRSGRSQDSGHDDQLHGQSDYRQ